MKKGVDIIIPYWGKFALLKETVDSVLAQTSDAWHLTILDDHYPSIDAYTYYTQLHDPRITYIRHKTNRGITENFNAAIKCATRSHCMIVGCDDRLLPAYVETMLATIGKADIYQPAVQVIDATGRQHAPLTDRVKRLLRPRAAGTYTGEALASSLCHGNWLYFPSLTWKTATLKRYVFDTTYTVLEDVILELDMILDGATLQLDNTETFQYRRFAESLSSKEAAKDGVRFREEAEVYAQFADKFTNAGWKKAARAARLRLTSRIHQIVS